MAMCTAHVVGATHTSFVFRANPAEKVRVAIGDRKLRLRRANLEAALQAFMTSILAKIPPQSLSSTDHTHPLVSLRSVVK